ncbi:tetratricopeptide repeat protein [Vibrio sp. SCSIO 43135]|uniref:tetratricopeptide repeat protein n=1 Tax=Vibrio sp. SCSIO 43135 TaxID=2819096 RepID=UPI00207574F9|nr:tetratricopeptide repeat protein [Vibrio sp. SCSIO 43135]USD40627.1 tetratricopeptide repeat protein [Vibrio sp. SCSIO 43135]
MNGFRRILTSTLFMLLVACAAQEEEQSAFDSPLYDGRPVDTLTSEAPPLNEKEAIMRGDIALANRNLDLALYEYIRSLSFPEAQYQDKSLYNIGRIHQSRGSLALAEKAYLLAIEENPNNVKVLEQLGSIYSKSGDVDQGYSYFLRALNADQVRLKSSNTLKQDDLVKAEDVDALKVDGASPATAYMGLGVLTDIKAHHELAQSFYNKALKINPKSVKGQMNLGYSYYMTGDYDNALRYTMSALEIDPNNEKAQNNLALIYLGKGEIKRAINVFMRQMDAAEALNNVGYFLILQGKPDKAIPYLQQAIDKKPSYYKVANENLERALAEVRAKSVQEQDLEEKPTKITQ